MPSADCPGVMRRPERSAATSSKPSGGFTVKLSAPGLRTTAQYWQAARPASPTNTSTTRRSTWDASTDVGFASAHSTRHCGGCWRCRTTKSDASCLTNVVGKKSMSSGLACRADAARIRIGIPSSSTESPLTSVSREAPAGTSRGTSKLSSPSSAANDLVSESSIGSVPMLGSAKRITSAPSESRSQPSSASFELSTVRTCIPAGTGMRTLSI